MLPLNNRVLFMSTSTEQSGGQHRLPTIYKYVCVAVWLCVCHCVACVFVCVIMCVCMVVGLCHCVCGIVFVYVRV